MSINRSFVVALLVCTATAVKYEELYTSTVQKLKFTITQTRTPGNSQTDFTTYYYRQGGAFAIADSGLGTLLVCGDKAGYACQMMTKFGSNWMNISWQNGNINNGGINTVYQLMKITDTTCTQSTQADVSYDCKAGTFTLYTDNDKNILSSSSVTSGRNTLTVNGVDYLDAATLDSVLAIASDFMEENSDKKTEESSCWNKGGESTDECSSCSYLGNCAGSCTAQTTYTRTVRDTTFCFVCACITEGTCTKCDPTTGDALDIICDAGYEPGKDGSGAFICNECSTGTFNGNRDTLACERCPCMDQGTCNTCNPITSEPMCGKGTGIVETDGVKSCQPCGEGQYKNEVSYGACSSCKCTQEGLSCDCDPVTGNMVCPSGFEYNEANTGCVNCPVGHYKTGESGSKCQKCQCVVSETCTTCNAETGIQTNVLCNAGKEPMQNSILCKSCDDGYYSDVDKSLESCKLCKCREVDENCVCGKETGNYLCGSGQESTADKLGCQDCPAGTFKFTMVNTQDMCSACPIEDIDGCNACDKTLGMCTGCEGGYTFADNGCIACGVGEWSDGQSECKICTDSVCKKCNSKTGYCEECVPGLVIVDGLCTVDEAAAARAKGWKIAAIILIVLVLLLIAAILAIMFITRKKGENKEDSSKDVPMKEVENGQGKRTQPPPPARAPPTPPPARAPPAAPAQDQAADVSEAEDSDLSSSSSSSSASSPSPAPSSDESE